MSKDALYEGEREVRTFVDLAHGVNVLIMKTEQDPKGSYYTTMGSLLLTAFTFEAYCNHLGDKKIKFWSEIDRISIMNKYNVLCKEFQINSNFSKRPYQTLNTLFKFRDSIAHGKSKILKATKEVNAGDEPYMHTPKAEWEEYCNLENAKRAKEDVYEIIKELNISAGIGEYPFIDGLSIGSIALKKQKNNASKKGVSTKVLVEWAAPTKK